MGRGSANVVDGVVNGGKMRRPGKGLKVAEEVSRFLSCVCVYGVFWKCVYRIYDFTCLRVPACLVGTKAR